MKSKPLVFLFFFLPILIVGCAHDSVMLLKSDMRPYKDFASFTQVEKNTASIQLVEVLDFRKNIGAVGVARTGVQYKKTPVVLPEKLDHFISKYFKRALTDRKVNIVEHDASYKLTIKINELWLEEMAKKVPETVYCNANFTFELKGEKRNFQTNIWNETTSPGDLADGTSKLAPTFSSCLNLVVEKLIKSSKFVNFIKN